MVRRLYRDLDSERRDSELSVLLSNFGAAAAIDVRGDLDGDGAVNLGDLARLLPQFGQTCP